MRSSPSHESPLSGGSAGDPDPRTFRGRSLSEILPQIKEELGDDAVAVEIRHGRTGGVGGFFAQRCVEVDAVPGPQEGGAADPASGVLGAATGSLDGAAAAGPGAAAGSAPAHAAFEALLATATARAEGPVVAADVPGSWEQLLQDARSTTTGSPPGPSSPAAHPAPSSAPASPPPRGASPLAALFAPDAAPEPVAPFVPTSLVASVPTSPAAAPAAVVAPASAEPVRVEPAVRAEPAPAVPLSPAWPDAALAIHRALTEKGMEPGLVSQIIGEAVDHLLPFSSEGSLRPLVAGQLARCLPPLPHRRAGRVVIGFVGAGGAGKTRCAARLALAYARRGDRPVACLSLRPRDHGAELTADVSAAGVPVHAAQDAAGARAFVESMGERALVVVDTPGVSPTAEAELRRLAGELRQLQLDECHLTLPATLSPGAAGELVRGARTLGVDALVLTHVDETGHLGAAIGAAIAARLPISYVGRGDGVRGGLRPALVEALALELVG